MNLFALSGLIASINSLAFGIFSWIKGKKSLNKIWALFNLSVAVWAWGAYKFSSTLDRDAVFFWLRFGHVGVVFIPVLFVHFVVELLDLEKKRFLSFFYGVGVFFSIINITDWLGLTKVFIVSLRFVFDSFYVDSPPGPIYPFFVLFFFAAVVYAHYLAFTHLKTTTGLKLMQIKYFFVATALGFSGGGTAFPMVFNIDIYPLLHFTVGLYPIIMTYAIFKYRLMDIRVAVTRTAVFAFVYVLVLSVPFLVGYKFRNEPGFWWMPIGLAVIFAVFSPILYAKLRAKAEDIVSKNSRYVQDEFLRFSAEIFELRDLDRLGQTIVKRSREIIQPEFSAIYTWSDEGQAYLLRYGDTKKILGVDDNTVVPRNAKIISVLQEGKKPFFFAELAEGLDQESLPHDTIIVPFFTKLGLYGFLILGPKQSKDIYSPDEFKVFEILGRQASWAFENAMLIKEHDLLEAQHQHISKMAVLGDIVSGVCHNLNNRFNCILTLADLCLKTHFHGADIDAASHDELRGAAKSAAKALENIRNESRRGFDIAAAVNASAREKVEPQAFLLEYAVKLALDHIRVKKDIKHIAIIEAYQKNGRLLWASTSHIQDVIFNLLDNACDAVDDKFAEIRKGVLRQENYRGEIVIDAEYGNEEASIHVRDNGIGIDNKHLESVGQPFFSTKAGGGHGTGLGVTMVKKLLALNSGRLQIESVYGKGSVFTFTLPLAGTKNNAEDGK